MERIRKEYKIALVGTEELVLGLKLSGVNETHIAQGPDAERLIGAMLQREDLGLIIVTSAVMKGIRDRRLLALIDSSILPMVIEVPGFKDEPTPDTLRRLIIRAIGIDIGKTIG